jgi:hypothetical protein
VREHDRTQRGFDSQGARGVAEERRTRNRWRYRRRCAAALLAIGALIATVVVGTRSDSEQGSLPATSASDQANDARRAARLERLRQQVKEAKEAAPPPVSAAGSPDAKGRTGSFDALAAQLPGPVGIAYTSPGRDASVHTLGGLQSGAAWSTIKVALAAKVIKDAGGSGSLSSSQRSLISQALRASDNDAAMALWQELVSRYGGALGAARAVTRILREAGDGSTSVSSVGRNGFSPYGQTEWSLAAQARFMAALAGGCVPGSKYLLGEMSQVAADQRWGLATAGSDAFKGGWGPGVDGGYLVREMGTLSAGGHTVVVAVAALPDDGQFATGQEMLNRISHWSADALRPPAPSGCES